MKRLRATFWSRQSLRAPSVRRHLSRDRQAIQPNTLESPNEAAGDHGVSAPWSPYTYPKLEALHIMVHHPDLH